MHLYIFRVIKENIGFNYDLIILVPSKSIILILNQNP